jgi:hypothetical protein
LLGKKLPLTCQESVMPKLIFGVFLHELVLEGEQIGGTQG